MPGIIQQRRDKKIEKAKTVIINPKTNVNFVALHANSSGEKIEDILALAIDGVVLAGDWNISLSDPANVAALKTYLDKNNLKIEISDEAVKKIHYIYKERSENSEYNQQGLKGGEPNGGTKDVAFKIVKKKNPNEASIPKNLENRLKKIQSNVEKFNKAIKKLADANQLTAATLDAECAIFDIINFQNPAKSHYNDHLSASHYDPKTNTICYAINTIEHSEYNFSVQFKDGVTTTDVQTTFQEYDKEVFTAIYKLVMKRDGIAADSVDFTKLSVRDLRKKLKDAFAANAQGQKSNPQGADVTRADIEECINSILVGTPDGKGGTKPATFVKINNQLLRDPFTQAEIDNRKDVLLNDESFKQFTDSDRMENGAKVKGVGKLERLVNVFYQSLAIDIPKKNDKTVSFKGNGFPAFLDGAKKVIPVAQIEAAQIAHMKAELNELHKKHPTAAISVALIEGLDQPNKIKAMRDHVDMLNAQVKMQRESNNNFYFLLNVGFGLVASAASVAGIAVAGLALAGIMTIVTAGIAGILVGAAVAGFAAYSLFSNSTNYRNQDTSVGIALNEVIDPAGPYVAPAP